MSLLIRNGWKIYFYTAFRKTYDDLTVAVESIKTAQPQPFAQHPKVKLFKRLQQIIFDEIPNEPGHARYNLGNTLGPSNRHWRRTKLFDRFRLFFRYHSAQKIIVYVWINDEKTLRQAGSKNDPYALFEKRLMQNDPPNDWNELIKLSHSPEQSE